MPRAVFIFILIFILRNFDEKIILILLLMLVFAVHSITILAIVFTSLVTSLLKLHALLFDS